MDVPSWMASALRSINPPAQTEDDPLTRAQALWFAGLWLLFVVAPFVGALAILLWVV